MTTAQDKAIARSADHENLVGELVEAMKAALNYIENTESELGFKLNSGDRLRAALAKAEAQQ